MTRSRVRQKKAIWQYLTPAVELWVSGQDHRFCTYRIWGKFSFTFFFFYFSFTLFYDLHTAGRFVIREKFRFRKMRDGAMCCAQMGNGKYRDSLVGIEYKWQLYSTQLMRARLCGKKFRFLWWNIKHYDLVWEWSAGLLYTRMVREYRNLRILTLSFNIS